LILMKLFISNGSECYTHINHVHCCS
jgi:hypothetical protein